MAAEQRGCRETLIVHSEWLSLRERRGRERRKGQKERRAMNAGRAVESDQTLLAVYRQNRHMVTSYYSTAAFLKTIADFALQCTFPYTPLLKANREEIRTG